MVVEQKRNKIACMDFYQVLWCFVFLYSKEKLRALYGSWVLGLYSADFDEYDSYVKTSRTPSSQSLNKVS